MFTSPGANPDKFYPGDPNRARLTGRTYGLCLAARGWPGSCAVRTAQPYNTACATFHIWRRVTQVKVRSGPAGGMEIPMTVTHDSGPVLAGAPDVAAAFAALAKAFGPILQVSEPPDSLSEPVADEAGEAWRVIASPRCEHAWPPDLDSQARCERCGLDYVEFEL